MYQKGYNSRPEVKAKVKEYTHSSKFKIKLKQKIENNLLKVLQYYSKLISKSDIPCCNCCVSPDIVIVYRIIPNAAIIPKIRPFETMDVHKILV